MPTYVVLLGPPGAGKGTQAVLLSDKLGLPHISSGDIFRDNLKAKTDLGVIAEKYMNRGELVPDNVTINMIRERLSRSDCSPGALLDGFPRTPAQADTLDVMLSNFQGKVNAVPYIKVPDNVLKERLTGRWTCPQCGSVYHIQFNPPQLHGFCDKDGAELYQRDDDRLETVSRRIRVYFKQTKPLINYYRNKGVLVEVDGDQSIEAVSDALTAIFNRSKG